MSDISTFEPLQNLHKELCELLKQCVIKYMSSERLLTHLRGRMERSQMFLFIWKAVQRGCNMLLANI